VAVRLGLDSVTGDATPVPPSALSGDLAGQRGASSARVLVLNASYEPINVCTVRRAAVLVLKQRAEVLERAGRSLHSERLTMPCPEVIRLTTYVRVPRDVHRRKITRRAVFARDRWACQYCGSRRGALTVDHVIPRSKGGSSSWENIVTCCVPCNRRKGDQLPPQANMHPRETPRAPSPLIFIHVAAPTPPPTWGPYLAAA
jgi:5-methylcytosine-specific restriction endonuclease McrA